MFSQYNLSSKQKKQFFFTTVFLVCACMTILCYRYLYQVQYDKNQARLQGEDIAMHITNELGRHTNTARLLGDLYDLDSLKFLMDYDQLCAGIHMENLAISSISWAPDGVLTQIYPTQLEKVARGFHVLRDSVQGIQALQAIKTRKAVLAGPCSLREGGKGLILFTPHYDRTGSFLALSTIVIDPQLLQEQVARNLKDEDKTYNFTLWRTTDGQQRPEDAVFSRKDLILGHDAEVQLDIPGGKWNLTLEPIGGWTHANNMMGIILFSLLVLLILILAAYVFLYNIQLAEEVKLAEKQKGQMAEVHTFQKELMAARDAAEAANAAKTSFLFNMSHDIRTPMNAIMGFCDLLEKHQDNPTRRQDYLKKIEEASSVLLSIINNVLEMARIEKGTIDVEEIAWSAEQFIDTLKSVFCEMMGQKNIRFTCDIEVQNHYVFLDSAKLREVFINILSNAYKYTPAGGKIHLKLKEIPSYRPGYALYRTTVTDNGIGMSESFLPHMFEEFAREQNTTDAKVEGTGLGMPIVKRLVELMHGMIKVKSKKNEGTSITVIIPHRIAKKENLVEHGGVEFDPRLFEGKCILLAEDNDLNAEIATEILQEAGFIIERAEDGQIAVDMIKKADSNYYDLILMDIQMPNMNGYEATRTIRALADPDKAGIPILAMTANAFEEDKREAMRSGMNGHLAKPFDVNMLMKTLARLLK